MRSRRRDVPRISIADPAPTFGSWSAVVTQAVRLSHPMAKLGSRFAAAADKHYMSPAHCLMYVARRVAEARQARDRAVWFGGRFYNRLTGSDPDVVQLSGAVLANSLKWLGETVPDTFPRGLDLALQFEVAAQLDVDLRAKAAGEGMTK